MRDGECATHLHTSSATSFHFKFSVPNFDIVFSLLCNHFPKMGSIWATTRTLSCSDHERNLLIQDNFLLTEKNFLVRKSGLFAMWVCYWARNSSWRIATLRNTRNSRNIEISFIYPFLYIHLCIWRQHAPLTFLHSVSASSTAITRHHPGTRTFIEEKLRLSMKLPSR